MADEQRKAYGIDLGTTYSAIAWKNPNTGAPEIINDSQNSRDTLPSAVFFREDGEVLVGAAAKEDGATQPDRLMQFFKRWIGRDKDPDREIYSVDGETKDPIQLSAIVLGKIKEYAKAAGHDVQDVVITCPAYFDFMQQGATRKAGEIAGLNVLGIINEPTAAAINYCYNRYEEDQTVLVFDLGGGTFDVTILRVTKKDDDSRKVDVIASSGNAMLGGYDWDLELEKLFQQKYNDQFGSDWSDNLHYLVKGDVEGLKIKLSNNDKATFKRPDPDTGEKIMLTVSREEFEKNTADLLQKTKHNLDAAMSQAGVTDEQIDLVLLVGGSTRMPMIKNMLFDRFGVDRVIMNEPDKDVAKGAAIIAANMQIMDFAKQWKKILDLVYDGKVKVSRDQSGKVTVVPTGEGPGESEEGYPPLDVDLPPIPGLSSEPLNVEQLEEDIANAFGDVDSHEIDVGNDVARRTFGIVVKQRDETGKLFDVVDQIVHMGKNVPFEDTRTYYTPRDDCHRLAFPVIQSVSSSDYDEIKKDENGKLVFPDPALQMVECASKLVLEIPLENFLPANSPLHVTFKLDKLGEIFLAVDEPKFGLHKEDRFNFNTVSAEQVEQWTQEQKSITYAVED